MSSAKKLFVQPWELQIASGVSSPVDFSCVGISEGLEPQKILKFAIDNYCQHVCQKDGHHFDLEVKSSHAIIESGESFLEFPAATILSPSQINAAVDRSHTWFEAGFDRSSQKRDVLDEMTATLKAKQISETMSAQVIAVADELFTNAIYNAPFVDMITYKNPGVSRKNLEVQLTGGKMAKIFLSGDGERMVLGCQDPYGSLDLHRYLTRIHAVYQQGAAEVMNFGAGGAGIGSYIIFDAGSSLYFGVWPGHATIISCVFPVKMSNRKRTELAKHLHWVQR